MMEKQNKNHTKKQEQKKQTQNKQAQNKQVQKKQTQNKQAQNKQVQKKQTQNKQAQKKQAQNKQGKKMQIQKTRISQPACPYVKKCGGCDMKDEDYAAHLVRKQKRVEQQLSSICKVVPITGMEIPYHYRNKVHAVFTHTRQGIISGVYEEGTHHVVAIDSCRIEDAKADAIIRTIRELLKSFKIKTYNEDTGYGILRHVLIRRGFKSGQILVVLVTGSSIFPSKQNFVRALTALHPEITTIVQNINGQRTSMVLGEREVVLYGKGYIEDTLCGKTFRLSPKSFYQVNPVQTEKLYLKAIELAGLTGTECILDAYCGIGTIGLIASDRAGELIGVELNPDAVKDAVRNAKTNGIKNAKFYQGDAGKFMVSLMENQRKPIDVVFMDPPRAGSDEAFLSSVAALAPKKVVYISCNPETLARDLRYMKNHGYRVREAYPYDMFPWSEKHTEVCTLLVRDSSALYSS